MDRPAVPHPALRGQQDHLVLRAGEPHVEQAPFLVEIRSPLSVRDQSVLHTAEKDHRELRSLGRVQCHQCDGLGGNALSARALVIRILIQNEALEELRYAFEPARDPEETGERLVVRIRVLLAPSREELLGRLLLNASAISLPDFEQIPNPLRGLGSEGVPREQGSKRGQQSGSILLRSPSHLDHRGLARMKGPQIQHGQQTEIILRAQDEPQERQRVPDRPRFEKAPLPNDPVRDALFQEALLQHVRLTARAEQHREVAETPILRCPPERTASPLSVSL